jgi:zinc transport system permease protein
MQNAVLAGFMASIVCGISGTFVVIKRITFISGGIAHSILGGIGVAYYLGINPLIGAFLSAILSAILLGIIKIKSNENEDTLIGALWAIGMAVGVIFISLTPGYNTDIISFLFGNILLVSKSDLWILLFLNIFVLTAIFVFFRQFIAISFDEELAKLRGLKTNFLYIFLLIVIAVTIVVLIKIVGLILVISLLTLPAAIARLFTKSPSKMMIVAVILGFSFVLIGLVVSFKPNLPPGATIIVINGIFYIISLFLKNRIVKNKKIKSIKDKV